MKKFINDILWRLDRWLAERRAVRYAVNLTLRGTK